MSARCDLTDLLVDQCAHCLGHEDQKLNERIGAVRIHQRMEAKYQGPCALDCGGRIEVGDFIGRTDAGWACPRCVHLHGVDA